MNWLKKVARRLNAPFRKEKVDREMDDEMRFHLEMQTKENVSAGMSSDEAHYAALRNFGGVDQTKERCREQRNGVWIENFIKDIRFGVRMLRKNPGFTVVVVLTLAVGIGANTAIFSSADAILFRPLPFPQSNRLVTLEETDPQFRPISTSPGDFFEWREQTHSFESIAAVVHSRFPYTLTGANQPISVSAQVVSANYFATLEIHPAVGRDFLPSEDSYGKDNVAILSHGFWVREFGGRSDAINRTIQLDGRSFAIVGVMPESFSFVADGVDMWVPAVLNRQNHGARYFNFVVARLKSGVSVDQARSEMAVIADRLAKQFSATNKGYGTKVSPLLEDYVSNARPLMLALLSAVAFLLLICCVNIANLLLARALSRRKEIVIRAALGASRGRIVCQFLTESLLLATLGGGLGILIARWSAKLLITFAPPYMPRTDEISINGQALGFTCILTLLTGLAFGLLPVFQITRIDLNDALKTGARGSTKGGQRARGLLVISEIALALILLIGAGLFIRSLIELQRVDPGFQTSDAFTAKISLPRAKYTNSVQITAFADQATARFSALPEVQAVGGTVWMPLLEGANSESFTIGGWTITDPTKLPYALATNVTPGYFRAMGIPLFQGRFFTEHDVQGAPSVVLINEAMARRFFKGVNPIGQRIGVMNGGSQPDHWGEVVGIVGNVKIYSLRDDENEPEFYEPFAQRSLPGLTFVIRTREPIPGLPVAMRAAIYSVDKNLPIASIEPLSGLLGRSFSSLNFTVFLFAAFSIVALGLAAIGIYGVMAYFVTQRTNEIGIRIALGAQRANVLLLVFTHAARLAGIGLLIGLAGALALTQFLQSMLFGVGIHDPITFFAVAVFLGLIALAACVLPAVRAARIDPIVALRYE